MVLQCVCFPISGNQKKKPIWHVQAGWLTNHSTPAPEILLFVCSSCFFWRPISTCLSVMPTYYFIYTYRQRGRERENLPMMLLPPFDGWPHPLCAVNVPTQNKRRGVKTCRQLGDRIWLFSDRKSLCGKRSPNHLSNKLGWAMQSENPS